MILPNIVVDTREKRPLWKASASVEVDTLSAGDYSLRGFERKLAIERKGSVAEIANNITETRFKYWVRRLSEYKYPYIVCEFSVEDVARYPRGSGIPKWRWKYLRVKSPFIFKMLGLLESEHGINVIYAGTRAGAKRKIRKIFDEVVAQER